MYKVEAVHKNKAIDLHKQGNQNRVEYPVFLWVPLVQLAFNILSYRYLLKMWKDEKLLIWNDFDMILTPVFFREVMRLTWSLPERPMSSVPRLSSREDSSPLQGSVSDPSSPNFFYRTGIVVLVPDLTFWHLLNV